MTMQTQATSAATTAHKRREPVNLQKKVGSTVYTVSIHFSKTSQETLEDKILRLIKREVSENA